MTKRQMKAARMFFDGQKVTQISAAMGVHRTTIWRWFQREDVRKYYERYSRQWMERRIQRDGDKLAKQLDSDDPWEANTVANRIIDKYLGLYL